MVPLSFSFLYQILTAKCVVYKKFTFYFEDEKVHCICAKIQKITAKYVKIRHYNIVNNIDIRARTC